MPKKYTKDEIIEVLSAQREVADNGCHNFTGFKGPTGYGQAKYQGKAWRVPKLWWVLHKGEVPDGLHVLHNCDNPACFNLEHLRLGTHAENMHDKVKRNRQYRPVSGKDAMRHWAKLDENKVKIILQRLKQGEYQSVLAKEFNVCRQTMNELASGKTWKHLSNQSDLDIIQRYAKINKSKAIIGNTNTKGMSINKGASHGLSIFTEEQVREIKRSLKQDKSTKNVLRLALQYQCSHTAIYHIRSGRRWSHVEVD